MTGAPGNRVTVRLQDNTDVAVCQCLDASVAVRQFLRVGYFVLHFLIGEGAMPQTVGERIKELRDQAGLSQEGLLDLARPYIPAKQKFARGTLSRIENNKRRPNGWQLESLARGLGKSVDSVMGVNTVGEAGEDTLAPTVLGLAQRLSQQLRSTNFLLT